MSRTLGLPAALAMVAVVALISAGCGGTRGSGSAGAAAPAGAASSTGTGSSGGPYTISRHAKAVKFAECMRANGVSAFPDPDATGALTIDAVANGSALDTSSAAFEQALGGCKELEPPGFTGHERNALEQEGALKFAQCMRTNGVKDFPDPAKGQPLIDTNRIPSTAQLGGMSILHAAGQRCRGFAAAAGVTGGR